VHQHVAQRAVLDVGLTILAVNLQPSVDVLEGVLPQHLEDLGDVMRDDIGGNGGGRCGVLLREDVHDLTPRIGPLGGHVRVELHRRHCAEGGQSYGGDSTMEVRN
jgi:hypothetical protein